MQRPLGEITWEMGMRGHYNKQQFETVSTDFDTSGILYFERLTYECVMDVLDREKPTGVIVQFGGQTSISLAEPLARSRDKESRDLSRI